ncbi:MAG: PAS domain S-box protein [Bacteroidetes bacterium]|nr:MAG: PAS domain S-box protein [Bacteroidota bacterium]
MRLLLLRFLIFLLPALLLPGRALSQLYTFKNFNHKNGLITSNITSLLSSENGSLYVGTDGAGLIRFDGRKFHEVGMDSSFNRHHVCDIKEFEKKIYFGSKYRGIYKIEDGKTNLIAGARDYKGEVQRIELFKKSMLIISTKGVYLNSKGTLEKIYDFKEDISRIQTLKIHNGELILTDQGNFYFSQSTQRIVQLHYWLRVSSTSVKGITHAIFDGQKVSLFTNDLTSRLDIVLESSGKIFSYSKTSLSNILEPLETIKDVAYSSLKNEIFFLTTFNKLYVSNNGTTKRMAQNYFESLQTCNNIVVDASGDLWIGSNYKGIYKVSLDPFTQIQLNPVYRYPDIFSIHKTKDSDIILSTGESGSFISNIRLNQPFQNLDFRILNFLETESQLYMACSDGLRSMNIQTKKINLIPGFEGKKINLIQKDGNTFFIGIADSGLIIFDSKDFTLKKIFKGPRFIYTATKSPISKIWYLGTNEGVFELNPQKLTLKKVPESKTVGYYFGNSTLDVYKTVWFTGDDGLFGILANGETVSIKDNKYFNSKLLYTLSADKFGNLIIGTNKGITILPVNELGKPGDSRHFTGETGFGGFETHMRAQFQDDNILYVGTIEGLFSINTELLKHFPKPTPPVIQPLVYRVITKKENSYSFQLSTNNPKINNILYSYRIKGFSDEWSELSNLDKIYLSELSNGDYTLEVRSSYDGIVFSDTSKYTIHVNFPFWKTKWFILFLISLIVLINIFIVVRYRSFDSGNYFRTQDTSVELNITPSILLFAFFSDVIANYIAPIIDPAIPEMMGLAITTGFGLLSLYLLSKSAERSGRKQLFRLYLILAYFFVLSHYVIGAFLSNLNPFYIFAISMILCVSPFVFERIKWVIIQNLIILVICSSMTLYLDQTHYNKYLFLFVVLAAAFMSIMISFLRNDSLEKLIFISGVVNQGNAQVVAFNKDGKITYASENINQIVPIKSDELLHQHISFLNKFLPQTGGYRNVDLTSQFFDGQKYLVPFLNSTSNIKWIEWSCKVFSDNVKVILGQDVSDRKELENTYELLVQNAEDLIFQCDVNGNFQFLNNRMYEILEFDKDEINGKSALTIVPDEYREQVQEYYQDHFKRKLSSSYFEFPIQSRNGRIIWLGQHVTTQFQEGSDHYIKGFLALARDITEIRAQQEIIKEQRDDITSSIEYAQRIQMSLMPQENSYREVFNESFAIFHPKDIVSGDFHWIHRTQQFTVVAVGDCTGHGVPGAFMTLLGINMLNSIVLEGQLKEPGLIMNEMDQKLREILSTEIQGTKITDGIELTICVFDHAKKKLSYSCAGSRFLIWEDRGFNMFKGDIKHIGDRNMKEFRGYITHELNLSDNSIIYLFTDGMQDQFGGPKNKKFSFRRLLEMLEENIRLPLPDQKIMIEDEFLKWKSSNKQTDDITIIGMKI